MGEGKSGGGEEWARGGVGKGRSTWGREGVGEGRSGQGEEWARGGVGEGRSTWGREGVGEGRSGGQPTHITMDRQHCIMSMCSVTLSVTVPCHVRELPQEEGQSLQVLQKHIAHTCT